MQIKTFTQFLVCLILGIGILVPAAAQMVPLSGESTEVFVAPSLVLNHVDDARLVSLTGNVHPMALAKFDKGRVDPGKLLERLVLVLKRSPEQEAALAAFNERQYDPNSPDFHQWLHAGEFGKLYGPSDSDITQVTSWLENHGFQIYEVSKGRVWIQFTGTVRQVEEAFHVEMHNYLVEGRLHIANDRDPEIPEALFPVVTGIASLHDFRPRHFSHPGNYVKRNMKTGKYTLVETQPSPDENAELKSGLLGNKGSTGGVQPDFGYVDPNTGYQREELSPYDVATIYNILPLWTATKPINGSGVKVAIVGLSDVVTADFNLYRSSFGLPAGTLVTLHSGADPGLTDSQGENTEDTEMVSATAPGATVVLVADVSNATTDGLVTAVTYIVNNEVAPILTMSYGACELDLGASGNSLYNQTFQQAATAGISSFVAAGDSGSAVCTSQDGTPPYADTVGLAVSGMASTPYATAVGGTDLQWPFVASTNPYTDYWYTTNNPTTGASAKGYMPEMSWNDTCSNPILLNVYSSYSSVEALCNAAITGLPGLVEMASGGGGVSNCTAPSGTTASTCAGGYAKPSWQAGVTGIPANGKRNLPDVSMFAAYGFQSSTGIPGSALLICESQNGTNGCDYSDPDYIIYQENGGTSAASPMTAGIMALVVQKTGRAQGLANPVFYSLAAKETYTSCNSNTVAAGNSCIFYDTTTGSNAAVCMSGDPNCVTSTSGDEVGILSGYSATTGYDLTTGLGSLNVANLVNAWPASAGAFEVTLSPTSLTFASTNTGSTTAAQLVTVKNSGTATLALTSETITGTNASSFVKSATTCGTSLAIGATCTVSVEFKPVAGGALTAALSVADNGAGSPQAVKLSGTGVAVPLVTLAPTSLTFASTNDGATTAAQLVTVKNSGTAALALTSATITGTNASSFVKSATTCGTSLAVGATCTVSVEFKPVAAGALTATLSIADSAAGSPQAVKLSGTGVATMSVTPSSIAFPATVVGATSDAQTVTVKNTGTATVTLKSIVLGGTNASSFEEIGTCGTTLAVGASCSMYVAFKPASSAALSGTTTMTASVGSPVVVTLTGTGTATPTVKLSATTLTFPTTPHGTTSAAKAITLMNSGTATLTLSSITLTGTNPADFEALDTCGATLAPAASCTVYVAFKPAAAAAYKATLSIADSGASSPQTVALSGTGS